MNFDFGGLSKALKGSGTGTKNTNDSGLLGMKRKYLDPIGDPLNIFGDAKNHIEDYVSGKQASDVKAAYDQAMAATQANAKQLMDFYNQREQRAQGFYQPMQNMFNSAYGTKGIQGPVVPKANGGVLGGMFGGGR